MQNYEKKIKDENFVENERKRGREKYKRLYSGEKQHNDKNTNSVRISIERKLGKLNNEIELHHWNYNDLFSVIALNRRIHAQLHQMLIYNKKEKISSLFHYLTTMLTILLGTTIILTISLPS